MAEKLGVGFYGAGGIVQNRLAEGVQLSEYARLVGAYDPSQASLGKLAEKFSGIRLYPSPDALLADGDVQVVAVATPHHLHYEHAKSALEARKHAWVEKPLSPNFNEAYDLGLIAQEHGLGLVVDSMMKNNWLNQQAAKMVREGKIGKVLRVETNMEFPYADLTNFRYQEGDFEGGGAAWDVGPHCLYMAMFLTGATSIDGVIAEFGPQMIPQAISHQSLYMNYRLGNGVIGSSNISFTTHWMGFEKNLFFRVIGTDGIIEGYGTLFQHSETCKDNDQHLVVYDKDGTREIRTPQEGAPNIYAVEFDRLAGPVVKGEKPPIDLEAISLVMVIRSALSAARNGIPGAGVRTRESFCFKLKQD